MFLGLDIYLFGADWKLGLLTLPISDPIKCYFKVGSEPLWACGCSILDSQDAINELRGIHFTPVAPKYCGSVD